MENQQSADSQLNTSPNQPQPASQSFFRRWLPTIAGIAIVVFVGGGVLAYQQWWSDPYESPEEQPATIDPAEFPKSGERTMEDETADWKVYRNEELGFEIKYLQDWKVVLEGSTTVLIIKKEDAPYLYKKGISQLKIDIDGNGRGVPSAPRQKSSIAVGGIEGTRTDYLTESGDPFFATVRFDSYDKNGWDPEYNIIYLSPAIDVLTTREHPDSTLQNPRTLFEGKAADFEIIDRMFSTFTFTDQDTETADWKTYRNEEFGFEVKYPLSWQIFSTQAYWASDEEGRMVKVNPIIYIYKDEVPEAGLNATFIAVIPMGSEGRPVLGVGEIRESARQITAENEELSLEALLEDGSVFAYWVKGFRDAPLLWDGGSVIGRVKVSDAEITRGEALTFYISGEIDGQDLQIIERILSTFKFMN